MSCSNIKLLKDTVIDFINISCFLWLNFWQVEKVILFYKLRHFFNSACGGLIISPSFEGHPIGQQTDYRKVKIFCNFYNFELKVQNIGDEKLLPLNYRTKRSHTRKSSFKRQLEWEEAETWPLRTIAQFLKHVPKVEETWINLISQHESGLGQSS